MFLSSFCVLVMYYRLFLSAALLTCCTGESSEHGPPEKVLAFADADVILPCSFNITDSHDFPTVEWSKEGLQPNVIFLYRDGCETYEMKNPAFEYRTNLITKQLKNGNISLRISNVRLSDAGKYQCMRLWKNAPRDITTVELVVGAVSEPKLSVISAESGGVTLQCEANCWLPEPEIKFLDDQGNNIPADDPKREDASGCSTVRRRVTLQDATNRVTCRVHQPDINQTRDTEILIPVDYMRSCSLTTGIAVGEAILLVIALLCGLAVLLWKRCGKYAEGQKLPVTRQSSDQSTMSGTSENQPFLKSVRAERADNAGNSTIEKLTREVADLKSKLHEKEETIRQLRNNNKSQLSPVVCHHDQPTIVYSPSKCSPDVPKPFSPPSDHSPKARNLPNDHNPKSTASTNSNPPVSGSLPQNKGLKPAISRQNSNPALCRPIQRNRIHSSPAVLNFNIAVSSSSSSANTSKKKLGHIGHSMSESCAQPGPNVPKLQRRHSLAFPSSNNRFTLLADLTEELEQLM